MSTRRSTNTPSTADVWQTRTDLVKKQMAAESAANDAKTARLKALRLERDAQAAEAARQAPEPKARKQKIKTPRA